MAIKDLVQTNVTTAAPDDLIAHLQQDSNTYLLKWFENFENFENFDRTATKMYCP